MFNLKSFFKKKENQNIIKFYVIIIFVGLLTAITTGFIAKQKAFEYRVNQMIKFTNVKEINGTAFSVEYKIPKESELRTFVTKKDKVTIEFDKEKMRWMTHYYYDSSWDKMTQDEIDKSFNRLMSNRNAIMPNNEKGMLSYSFKSASQMKKFKKEFLSVSSWKDFIDMQK